MTQIIRNPETHYPPKAGGGNAAPVRPGGLRRGDPGVRSVCGSCHGDEHMCGGDCDCPCDKRFVDA